MARVTKGMIEAAHRELNCICDLASEAHAIDNSGLVVLHATSANNYLDVLKRASGLVGLWCGLLERRERAER